MLAQHKLAPRINSMHLKNVLRQINTDGWTAYNNIMFALASLGNEEGAVRVGEQMIKAAGGRPGRASENLYSNYDGTVWNLPT